MPVGAKNRQFTDLIFSHRMRELLVTLRRRYDLILIDTPPVLAMPEARVTGRFADAVLLVIRAGHTDYGSARAAQQRLSEDGIAVRGIVFNDWDPAGSPAYRQLHRYYAGRSATD
jgi:Mrp family chromosome partitioning ATPase